MDEFYDAKGGGFYLYGKNNEQLIFRPKETYDGAIPSGNSIMAYNLVRLSFLTRDTRIEEITKRQMEYMSAEAEDYPAGHTMFLLALLDDQKPVCEVTIVLSDQEELAQLPFQLSLSTLFRVLPEPTKEYSLKNEKTTYYVCKNHSCQAPVNQL